LPDLGLDPRDQAVFNGWISRPSGIVLITGPTGSGKTTTLYTTLKALAHEGVNVTTVEDPIEMITDCFNQVAAQPKIGIDFANAMRAILRQDPDIIMVGEIRDSATAEMAAQAALTGHLVFSTLHTNDTPSAVTRLVDLGVPRFLIASTVVGVMAQRLVRLICSRCHTPTPLSDEQLRALGVTDPSMFAHTAQGRGCVECRGTGYRGRIGVFELLSFDHTLADAVTSGATENALRDLAKGRGLRSFGENALDRLAAGITTFEEVMRVRGPGATLLNEEPPPTPPESVDLTELAILTDDSKDDPR
jgi:general secretion pathway protein E